MAPNNLDDLLNELPVLNNPSTPSLRRLRKRLEQQVADPESPPKMKSAKSAKAAATSKTEAPAKATIPASKPLPLHPLVAATKFVRVAHQGNGRVLKNDPDGLDIRVITQFPRALDIMNRLLQALTANGFQISLEGQHMWTETVARCAAIRHTIHIVEGYRRKPHQLTPEERAAKRQGRSVWLPTWDFEGTGALKLVVGGIYWDEHRHARIENGLDGIVARLVESVAASRREEERLEAIKRAHQEEEERQARMKHDIERLGFHGWLYDGLNREDVTAIKAANENSSAGLYERLYGEVTAETPDIGYTD